MSVPAIPVVEMDVFDKDGRKLNFVLTMYGYKPAEFFNPDSVVHARVGEIFRRRGWRDLGYSIRATSVRERRFIK